MSAPGPDRAISTHDPRFPACVMHLPSRFALRIALFSATENRYDPLPAEAQHAFALGEHTLDGDYAALTVTSAGTTLSVEFARGEWSGVSARVRILEPGEMLFRLGIMIEAGFLAAPGSEDGRGDDGLGDRAERELALCPTDPPALMAGALAARRRRTHVHVALDPRPTMSGQYPSPAGVAHDLEHRGWLHHPAPCPEGDWVAFRLTGDPRATVRVALALESDGARAAQAARTRLADTDRIVDAAAAAARAGSEPARALRDVVAWNTVWDHANQRIHTAASRGWLRGFGGWGVWLSDALYAALLAAHAGDAVLARENLRAAFAEQQPAGNLPCLAAADETWVDRTQLPVAATMTWRVYEHTGERSLLTEAHPVLSRHLHWLLRERDGNRDGLYEYGSSPTGSAQWAFTRQGALNESGMDNLAVFDDAVFVESAHTIDLAEPGHNALVALECEAMGWICAELGHPARAAAWAQRARGLRERIVAELWDGERGIYAARHWDGRFAEHVAPTGLFPLVAGAVDPARVDGMLERWLWDPARFGGPLPLPSAPLEDPVSAQDSYWRGRIWAPMLYWVWEGLHRAGRRADARELARRAWEMFAPEWRERRHCHENFSARDPTGHEAHDSDPFYTWGALIALMWDQETTGAVPWMRYQAGTGNDREDEG